MSLHQKDSLILFPARLLKLAPTQELMQRALADSAFDATVFDELKPFFFSAEISNSSVDSYFTRMGTSTLKNYAAEAKAGVSLQDSHNNRRLGVGRSLNASYLPDGDIERVVADFYTVKGIKFNDATYESTDDFINAIRAGIAQDVSVGFHGGEYICSVCKVDMWDWDKGCRHWPGDEVEIKDPDSGKVIRTETVTASVVNAHLSEVSLVYAGSTPGAAILKAERAIIEGVLRPEAVQVLEQRYRIKLPDSRLVVPVGNSTQEDRQMDPKELADAQKQARETYQAEIRALLTDGKIAVGDDLIASVRQMITDFNKLKDDTKDLEALRKLADDGKAYRADLITSSLAEGVRAYGKDFQEETYRGILEGASIETVKRMRDDWKITGDKNFPGGRSSKDLNELPETQPQKRQAPDAAYLV